MQGEATVVSELPIGARSALETLRLQRTQKHGASDPTLPISASPAPVQNTMPREKPDSDFAPMQDTLPDSGSPMQASDTQPAAVQKASCSTLGEAVTAGETSPDEATVTASAMPDQAAVTEHAESAPLLDTLPDQALLAGSSESAPMQDTLADESDTVAAKQSHSINVDRPAHPTLGQNSEKQSNQAGRECAAAAPVSDTLDIAPAVYVGVKGIDTNVEDEDDALIRQAVAGGANDEAAEPQALADQDNELLQQLLDEQ